MAWNINTDEALASTSDLLGDLTADAALTVGQRRRLQTMYRQLEALKRRGDHDMDWATALQWAADVMGLASRAAVLQAEVA